VKKGESPNKETSSTQVGGWRNTSTSEGRANCGILVSNFVETITVLARSGSTCSTKRKQNTLLLVETIYQLDKDCAKSSSGWRVNIQESNVVFFFMYGNPISEYSWWKIMQNIIVL
jgi:hypothetical protein